MENKYHNYRVEIIVRKGEIACYKQFSSFLTMFFNVVFHNVFHSYIPLVRQNVVLCGSGLKLY